MTEDFRKHAPAPLAPREFNLPVAQEAVLSNGLKLVAVEDRRLPIFSVRLLIKSGRINDPQDLPGLSAMMTSMLNEGTKTRTSAQLADEIERIGASLGAGAGADNTTVSGSALSKFKTQILNLMADIVLNPTFPADELAIARDNAIQGLVAQRAQPSFLSNERLSKVLFGEHPYSVVSATEESLNAITSELLAAAHKRIFVPNNAVMVVVGAIDFDELKTEIENLFGAWEAGDIVQNEFPAPPAREKREIHFVDRAGSAQSNIVLANPAFKRNHPDFFPAVVMNQVLGAGASSRLFMNLREQKDFTYGAYSSFDMRRLAGAFEATSEVRSSVTGDALHEFFYELDRIRDERVPDEELGDAKNYLTGVFPIRLETQEGLVGQLLNIQKFNLPADFLQTYRENISAVTADDVQRVAQSHIAPEKMAIVIVGDAATVLEQVKTYADDVQLFDTNGKRKEQNNNMNGTATEIWNLTLSSPQGDVPVTLKLNTDGGNLSGTLNTPMGDGTISGGTYDLKTLSTSADLSFQGMPINVKIEAAVDGDSINGSVNTGIIGSLPFKGTRAS